MSRTLYVGNLPYEIGESELQELFARVGGVESVNVMRDQATGRARGDVFRDLMTIHRDTGGTASSVTT